MPYKQMHFDSAVFGANAKEFGAMRLLDNKNLTWSTSFRPFGVAATHCPERFLARREVYMFVVHVIHRFDIRLDTSKDPVRFPQLEETIPSGGVLTLVMGDGVTIKIRPI
jgi:hypothetical protein